jgi:hypothetical protein
MSGEDLHCHSFDQTTWSSKCHFLLFLLEVCPYSCPMCSLTITCIEEDIGILLNAASFRLNHIAHNMAPIATKNIYLSFELISQTQAPNMCLILLGGANPATKWIIVHIYIASTQSKKRCWVVSLLLQKIHISFSCQFLLTKLSLVSIASL